MYLGVIALWRTIDDPTRGARAVAVLTLVGAINIPIIKFSVDWWNTLHQPASVLRLGASTIHPTILGAAGRHDRGVHAAVPDAAPRRHAQRDRAAEAAHLAADASRRCGGRLTMDLGPHAGFIVTAYAVAIVIVAGLIVWVMLDRRHLSRAVDELEAKGITRRSERARGDATSVEKP